MAIPRALVPIEIDGTLSDWRDAPTGPFAAPHLREGEGDRIRNPDGPGDFSAHFQFAWDDSNLYIAAVVTDDVHVQFARTRGDQLYRGDDLELWLDMDLEGDFDTTMANADDYQLGLSPGDFGALAPEAFFWNPTRSDARNKLVTVAARKREDVPGYTLEAAVPWVALGDFRPQKGAAIGFAASAGDNDQIGKAIQEVMLSTSPAMEFKRPQTWGNLFF
jgi:hypothetical protein